MCVCVCKKEKERERETEREREREREASASCDLFNHFFALSADETGCISPHYSCISKPIHCPSIGAREENTTTFSNAPL